MKEAILILVFVALEVGLGTAYWMNRRDLQRKLEGKPWVDTPFNVLWASPIVVIAAAVAYHFAQKGDWLSMGMQLLVAFTTCLSLWHHARRCVVNSVPPEQVTAWMEQRDPSGADGKGWVLTDHWLERRSVSIELRSGRREDLLALAAALRTKVRAFPSPGPWVQPGLGPRIAQPILIGCMLLFPLAIWLIAHGR